ncbi:GNAT family N-acetyltransferase [Actinoplanes cyaneus]|uniref:GNAT family N-acetyltransferase n=1 Tax=Actinoplanes cyaneus TaxID=52696 RepID=UPI001EF35154|nr:GNAT family N-acetyltransferase [Actinoplanes cyaneus]
MFDLQPVLSGDLVGVRPLLATDFEALYRVASDPLIWVQHPASDRHERRVFHEFFAQALASGGALAVTSPAGEVIGSSRFHGYDPQRSEVEIGWTFLSRAYWGGPTNGNLKALLRDHAFRFVERIVFLVAPDNRRSQRALEKVGAVRAGTRLDGSGRDSFVFEMRRSPFSTQASGLVDQNDGALAVPPHRSDVEAHYVPRR